jgi:hypothetical protein
MNIKVPDALSTEAVLDQIVQDGLEFHLEDAVDDVRAGGRRRSDPALELILSLATWGCR